MPKFFIDALHGTKATITGADAKHIGRALRMRIGDSLTINADGKDYQCRICSITSDTVDLEVCDLLSTAEPSIELTLYQALPKSDKLEQIVQKAVELGATRIVPFLTQRCISRPNKTDFSKKQIRLQKIAEAAAKQSGRSVIPEIAPLYTFAETCTELAQTAHGFLLYEKGGAHFSELSLASCHQIAVVVGSEGGFSPEEAKQIEQVGITPVWLGKRILRCETAPLVAISIIMYKTGNL